MIRLVKVDCEYYQQYTCAKVSVIHKLEQNAYQRTKFECKNAAKMPKNKRRNMNILLNFGITDCVVESQKDSGRITNENHGHAENE